MRKKQALKSFAVLEYFDYSEGYYLMCKNTLGVLAYAGSFSKNFYSLKPIPQICLRGIVFEKTNKNQKYGSNISPQTFSKAVDRGVK